jgi:mannose-1-phosphate guanylyltransferase
MKALLLAAGLGTRLKPLTDNIPKCLVPIQGKPLLAYWLEMLTQAQVSPLLLNLHYKAEAVRDFISNGPYAKVVTCVYEETLLGTAGTLRENQAFFENEPLMLIHADNLSKFEVRSFIDRHHNRPAGCEITMMTFICPIPQSCGIVELDDRGVVQAFHEKVANPPGNLANGAVYIIDHTIVEFLNQFDQTVIDFSTQVLPSYLGKIYTFHNSEYHRDIGTWESYQAALQEFIFIGNLI